jgi:hypothetical protein
MGNEAKDQRGAIPSLRLDKANSQKPQTQMEHGDGDICMRLSKREAVM